MRPDHLFTTLSSALTVLTSMITPALLISACGTFILSTSNRLGRVVDRARRLSEYMEELMQREETIELFDERREVLFQQIDHLSQRAALLQRSLTVLYVAAGIFVATSVAIGIVSVFSVHFVWVPVLLGIVGACFLFWGSIILIFEARIAVGSLRSEMSFLGRLVNHHAAAKLKTGVH